MEIMWELNYLQEDQLAEFNKAITEVEQLLQGLIHSLRTR